MGVRSGGRVAGGSVRKGAPFVGFIQPARLLHPRRTARDAAPDAPPALPRFTTRRLPPTAQQAAGKPLFRTAFSRGSADGSPLFNPFDLTMKNVANTGVLHWCAGEGALGGFEGGA